MMKCYHVISWTLLFSVGCSFAVGEQQQKIRPVIAHQFNQQNKVPNASSSLLGVKEQNIKKVRENGQTVIIQIDSPGDFFPSGSDCLSAGGVAGGSMQGAMIKGCAGACLCLVGVGGVAAVIALIQLING